MGIQRNPLAYPGGLRNAGMNYAHPALQFGPLQFSGVAVPGQATFRRLDLSDKPNTLFGSPSAALDPIIGPAFVSASTAGAKYTDVTSSSPSGITFAAIVRQGSTATVNVAIGTAAGSNCSLYSSSSNGFGLIINNNSIVSLLSLPQQHPYFVMGAAVSGTSKPCYLLAVDLATGQVLLNTSTLTATLSNPGVVWIANNVNESAGGTGKIATAAVINGYVPPAVGKMWALDPWTFWYPPSILETATIEPYIAQHYSLSAAEGTYSLTGENATLGVGMSAAEGTYSLTGNAATLGHGRTLTAAEGTYSITGENAVLGIGISAVHGTYSLTGESAILSNKKVYVLSATEGTYSLTGKAATLNVGLHLHLAEGTYSLTGESASLTLARHQNYTLPTGFGVYNLTGLDAGLSIQIAPPVIPATEIADYVFQYENFAEAYADPVVSPYFRKGVMIALNALVFRLGQEVPISSLPLPGYWFVLSLAGPVNPNLFNDPNLAFLINRTGQSWNNATPVYRAPQFSQVNRLEILVSSSMIYVQ